MKKVINRKMYDTDTANLVGEYEYSSSNDLKWVFEELYQKKNGEFFLVCSGGPFSKYGVKCDTNTWKGTFDNVFPLGIEDAKDWAEKHISGTRYVELFGEVEE